MDAYVSTAGGCVQYRLFKNGDGTIRVECWHSNTEDGEMVKSPKRMPDGNYPSTLRAMIAIGDDMG